MRYLSLRSSSFEALGNDADGVCAFYLEAFKGKEAPMRNVIVERTIAVDRSSIWAVLADYPNIADWNHGLKNSYANSVSSSEDGPLDEE